MLTGKLSVDPAVVFKVLVSTCIALKARFLLVRMRSDIRTLTFTFRSDRAILEKKQLSRCHLTLELNSQLDVRSTVATGLVACVWHYDGKLANLPNICLPMQRCSCRGRIEVG